MDIHERSMFRLACRRKEISNVVALHLVEPRAVTYWVEKTLLIRAYYLAHKYSWFRQEKIARQRLDPSKKTSGLTTIKRTRASLRFHPCEQTLLAFFRRALANERTEIVHKYRRGVFPPSRWCSRSSIVRIENAPISREGCKHIERNVYSALETTTFSGKDSRSVKAYDRKEDQGIFVQYRKTLKQVGHTKRFLGHCCTRYLAANAKSGHQLRKGDTTDSIA